MRLLLDTHTFLWFFAGDVNFGDNVRTLVEDENHEKLLSITTSWEMAIKHSKGKLALNLPLKDYLEEKLRFDDFNLLTIRLEHLAVIATLPFDHSDPFDRLLVAQARVEGIPILSRDSDLDSYPIHRIW